MLDASTEPDAPGLAAYDVAYPDQWRFSIEGPISGYLVLVNTGTAPLNTASLVIESLTDDNADAVVRVAVASATQVIEPGQASGALSGISRALLVGSGLVTEPIVDPSPDYLTLEVSNGPAADATIHASIVLALDNVRVTLPMEIAWIPSALPEADADGVRGARLTATK